MSQGTPLGNLYRNIFNHRKRTRQIRPVPFVISRHHIQCRNTKSSVHRSTHQLHRIPNPQRRRIQEVAPTKISKRQQRRKRIKMQRVKIRLRPTLLVRYRITKRRHIGTTHQLRNHRKITKRTLLIVRQKNHKPRRKKREPHGQHTTHSHAVRHREQVFEFTHMISISQNTLSGLAILFIRTLAVPYSHPTTPPFFRN